MLNMRKTSYGILAAAILGCLVFNEICYADTMWQTDGIRVCPVDVNKNIPSITSDGDGSVFIGWTTGSGAGEIYLQKINSAGDRLWNTNGVRPLPGSFSSNNWDLKTDGSGGVYTLSFAYGSNIRAQRIDANGNLCWGSNGLQLSSSAPGYSHLEIITDPSHNMIAVWDNWDATTYTIYAQKINNSGQIQWTYGGITICAVNAADNSALIDAANDSLGNTFIYWKDTRTDLRCYIQKISDNGQIQWLSNGIRIGDWCESIQSYKYGKIVSDSSGGAIATWKMTSTVLFSQRIDSYSNLAWIHGNTICSATVDSFYYPQTMPDGNGGLLVIWQQKSATTGFDIYAQRIDGNGNALWTSGGIPVCNAASDQWYPQFSSDGQGGALITWWDVRNGNWDIYCQAVNSSGQFRWQQNGIAVCTASGSQQYPVTAQDISMGGIIAWQDGRNPLYDVYAQRVCMQTPTSTRTPTSTPTVTFTVTPTSTPTIPVYIYSASPNHSVSGKNITTTVVGRNFLSLPVLKLRKLGLSDIASSSVVVKSSCLLSATFSLASAAAEVYDLMIDMGGSASTLKQGMFVLNPASSGVHWEISEVGLANIPLVSGTKNGLAVGDGDNNSLQEVFATNRNHQFFRFSWQGLSWSQTALPSLLPAESYDDIVICDLNRDGNHEVYVAAQDRHVYQYSGASWIRQDAGICPDAIRGLACGDGDNDGELEIYAACADKHVYEFGYNAGWIKTDLGATAAGLCAVEVGDGNNDNQFEVYAAGMDHNLYEFKNIGSVWNHSQIGAAQGMINSMVIADADGNGEMEVYAACEDHAVYQFKKVLSAWNSGQIGSGNGVMYKIIYNDPENSGSDKLYAACGDGHIYQFSFGSNAWVKNDLGGMQTPLYSLAAGDGDNDHQFELYAIGENSRVYQWKAAAFIATPTITPTVTPTSILSGDNQIRALHNDFNPLRGERTTIIWQQGASGATSIKIFTMYGKLVRTLAANENFAAGMENRRAWDGKNDAGDVVASGIYLVYIQSGSFKDKVKVAVIKE